MALKRMGRFLFRPASQERLRQLLGKPDFQGFEVELTQPGQE
jgi:hypothetical protein